MQRGGGTTGAETCKLEDRGAGDRAAFAEDCVGTPSRTTCKSLIKRDHAQVSLAGSATAGPVHSSLGTIALWNQTSKI